MSLILRRLDGMFAVAKIASLSGVDLSRPPVFLAHTEDELSLACEQGRIPPDATDVESGFCCLKIEGVLDFSLVGILAGITSALASGGVSVFAVSTFNTDYILLKESRLEDAVRLLTEAGYTVAL